MRFGGSARVGLGGLTTLLGLLVAAPALAEPFITLSPPVEVDESREWVPRAASVADIATDGTNSLAVYSGYSDRAANEGYIIGRRLDAQGAPLELPFELYVGSQVRDTRIVFAGTGYVLLWTEGVTDDYSLSFMRLTTEGDVVTDPEVLEHSAELPQIAIAAGETGTFVARSSADGVRTWVLTSDKTVDGDPIDATGAIAPSAGFSDGTWLLAYADPAQGGPSHFVEYGGDGHLVVGTASSVAADFIVASQEIAAAADGFVVSREVGNEIDLVHVDFDGKATLGPYVVGASGPLVRTQPHALLATSSGYSLVFSARDTGCDNCDWWGWVQPLTPKLEAATQPMKLPGGADTPQAAALSGGADAQLTWRDNDDVLRAAKLSLGESPSLGSDSAVSVGFADQGVPRVAPGAFGWLAVWPEQRVTDGRVSGVLLDDAGNPEGNPVLLTPELETLSDLVRGPQGWLMVSEVPLALHLISEELQVTNVSLDAPSTAHARVAGSKDGWLVAWLQSVAGAPSLRVARVNEAGAVVDSTTVASVSDLTVHHALSHAGAYEVLWTDGVGNLWSVQIPTSGCLSVSVPQKLAYVGHAAHIDVARSADTWWGWMNLLGKFIFRTADGQVFPDDGFALPIVEVDGLALTGTKSPAPDSYLSIGLAAANSPLKVLATASGTPLGLDAADLSDSFEHRALLATLDPDWVAGEVTTRVTTRVITVVGGTPEGSGDTGGSGGCGNVAATGPGGEGGDAAQSDAGQSTGGTSAGSPDVPGAAGAADQPTGTGGAATQPTGDAGRTSTPLGGEPASTGNDGGDATAPAGAPPRTSTSCGCRAAGSDDARDGRTASFAAGLLLSLVWHLRRPRRSRRQPAA